MNLWLHRPLAYLFCLLLYRTRVTPNQVTLLSILLGLTASVFWLQGGSSAMFWGGVLLWSSAIVDGADGILARARNAQSAFGRALDGSADWIVGLSSVGACAFHLGSQGQPGWLVWLALPTTLLTVLQFNLFDFYKEAFVHFTRLDKHREGHSLEEVERLRDSGAVRASPWYTRWSMHMYADYTRFQQGLIGFTNPDGLAVLSTSEREQSRDEFSAHVYRRENSVPMQLWKALSTAPHAYLFSIFGMFDRLDLYLLLRLSVMSTVMLAALRLQRRASGRTLRALTV